MRKEKREEEKRVAGWRNGRMKRKEKEDKKIKDATECRKETEKEIERERCITDDVEI